MRPWQHGVTEARAFGEPVVEAEDLVPIELAEAIGIEPVVELVLRLIGGGVLVGRKCAGALGIVGARAEGVAPVQPLLVELEAPIECQRVAVALGVGAAEIDLALPVVEEGGLGQRIGAGAGVGGLFLGELGGVFGGERVDLRATAGIGFARRASRPRRSFRARPCSSPVRATRVRRAAARLHWRVAAAGSAASAEAAAARQAEAFRRAVARARGSAARLQAAPPPERRGQAASADALSGEARGERAARPRPSC